MKKGILLCGHGTRVAQGATDFIKFAEGFKSHLSDYEFSAGFLELSEPNFEQGVKALIEKKVDEIIAIPLFLFTGVHIEEDIPCTLFQLQKKYGIKIRMGEYLGVCNEMVDLCEHLIRKMVPEDILNNTEETAFILSGVGSSKIKANADIAAMTRLIQERFKFPFSTYGFLSRMTFPPLKETLKNISLLPYKNIIVLPYFFFQGVYMQRAMNEIKKLKKEKTDKQIFITSLLGEDKLYEVLQKRISEVLNDEIDMIQSVDKKTLEEYHGHHHDHHHHGHHHDDHCHHNH